MPTFQRFDSADCAFPPPRVPLLPVLRRSDLAFGRVAGTQALDGDGVRHFSRGRYALHAAYRAAGVGPDGALLAPAYHCRTMLDPALALGGKIIFYAVDEYLRPDLAAIGAALAQSPTPVQALVVPHYFGFRQPAETMAALAQMCRVHAATLVEDCAHGWEIALEEGPRCETEAGRMVIASPYKFFPSPDGGILWGNPAQLDKVGLSGAGAVDELKALARIFSRGSAGRNLDAAARARAPDARGAERTETGELMSIHYQRASEHKSGLSLSRWIVRHVRADAAAEQRRANYRRWLAATCGLRGARPLFSELPPACTPYMFPLLITAPAPQFFQLKQLGMPIWRWDDMAVSDCAVAAKMRLHLLHLPCHQSLSDEQMAWMTSNVASVVAA